MPEEKKEDRKEVKKEARSIVVAQLPTVEARVGSDSTGAEVAFTTIEEALTEILDIARQLKRGLI